MEPGSYQSVWRLMDASGVKFGDLLVCDILVKEAHAEGMERARKR